MAIYLCSVSGRFPENYHIGLQAYRWGVEEKYKNRITRVKCDDQLVFLVGGVFKSIHTIESDPFMEDSLLWPEKDGSIFPHRIKIGPSLAKSDKAAKDLADDISFMKGKVWGGTIQGQNGVFNNKLTPEDLTLIFGNNFHAGGPSKPTETATRTADRDPLVNFYEKDAEDCVERLLPQLGLVKFIDPQTGQDGRQYNCPAGRIDLLCRNAQTDEFVIVELKRGDAPDKTLLQILRYMSWVRQNLANNTDVRGIILTEGADDSLNGIVYEVPNVSIRYYKFNIELI